MIGMIAAIGKNRELGKDGKLIWNLPEDLSFFKQITMGKIIIMGKKTFNSLPKLLPGRKHVILSANNGFNKDVSTSTVFCDKDRLLSYLKKIAKEDDVYIIGGASMYAMFIDICDFMYLTEVDAEDKSADVYFPEFNKDEWKLNVLGKFRNGDISYTHVKYTKKD